MNMATGTLVPLEEYLHTAYEPDCDYVDGHVEERHVGERDHSRLQGLLFAFLLGLEEAHGFLVYPEQRIQVGARRYRIPDICVMPGPKPEERVFSRPPHLCVEILSSEDRVSRVVRRLNDYLTMGVQNIWVIDPEERACFTYSGDGLRPAGMLLRTDLIEVPMDKLFERL
jgi:Uma2 family endonuclease